DQRRAPTQLHVSVELGVQEVAVGFAQLRDVAAGETGAEIREIPIEDADRLPLREALCRAAHFRTFAADDLRAAEARQDEIVVPEERVVPGEAKAAHAGGRTAVGNVDVDALG